MAIRDVATADPLELAQDRLNDFSPVVFKAMWDTMHEALAHARERIAELETAHESKRPKRVRELETQVAELTVRNTALTEQLAEKSEALDGSEQCFEETRAELELEQTRVDDLCQLVKDRVRECQERLRAVLGRETLDDSIGVYDLRRALEDLGEIDRDDVP